MNVPRSVADVLNDHVVFEVECIDRMYCNVYIPGLQYAAGLVGYIHQQMGLPIASTAPIAKISDRFSAAVHRFARDQQVPWVDFVKGQRKDDVMHEYLAGSPVKWDLHRIGTETYLAQRDILDLLGQGADPCETLPCMRSRPRSRRLPTLSQPFPRSFATLIRGYWSA